MKKSSKKTIWIDLDNTPHVLFFNPIIPELEKRGFQVLITARDAYQVSDVATFFKIPHKRIGKHYGKNKLMKVIGTFVRAFELMPLILFKRPALAVSHGSRSQHVAANLLFIKSLDIYDYEHCSTFFFTKTTWALAPEVVVKESRCQKARRETFCYPGIKEDAYVPFFRPKIDIRKELGIKENEIAVLVRPPATEAHYHNPEAEAILDTLLHFLAANSCKAIVVPRNKRQQEAIESSFGSLIKQGAIIIPGKVYDGLVLIWFADLVVSGGGTMNREAAALGVPVYSIFRGKLGAVDRYLSATGKLILIENMGDVKAKIVLARRPQRELAAISGSISTLENIVNRIASIAQ